MSKTADADRGGGRKIDGEKRREITGAQKSKAPTKFMQGFIEGSEKVGEEGRRAFFALK